MDADTCDAPSGADISLACGIMLRKKRQTSKEKVHSQVSAVSENTLIHLPNILSRRVSKSSLPQLQFFFFFFKRIDKALWKESFFVYLFWCILCILGISKTTLAPGGLDPALFLMLGYLMAIWSHLSRYLLPSCPLDIAPPPIYFLSCSGSLEILVGSPKAS